MRLITTEDDHDPAGEKENKGLHIQLDLGPVVEVLTRQLSHKSIQTRVSVLRWVLQLHMKTPNKVLWHQFSF